MSQPLVIGVVLNTNRRTDTLACLESLARSDYHNHKTIVLDNHSTDGSLEAVRAEFPDVETIELSRNRGYAGNNNVGIRAALDRRAGWVLVLNEDTILDPSCLTELVRVGESDPQIGMVGPMVYHFDEPDTIQSAGGVLTDSWDSEHRGKDDRDIGQFDGPQEGDWLTGCAIMVRRAVIEQIGVLDEELFIYFEETEWCVRAQRAGWRIVHAPAAKLWHKGVQRNYRPTPTFTYYMTRNRLRMMAKHHAPIHARVAALLQTLRTLVSWTVKPKWRSMREHRDAMWQGLLDFAHHRMGMRPARVKSSS